MYKTEYLERFECIGSKCPNSCCIGWKIDLDKSTFEKYEKSQDSELKNNVIKNNSPNFEKYGEIKRDLNERCSFLDSKNLCLIQKKYGQGFLSTTCISFPRRKVDFGKIRVESGLLSCPEISRLFFENKYLLNILDSKNTENLNYFKIIPDEFRDNEYAIKGEKIFNSLLNYFKNEDNQLEKCLEYSINLITEKDFKFKKIDKIESKQIKFSKLFFEIFLKKKIKNKLTDLIEQIYKSNFVDKDYEILKEDFKKQKKKLASEDFVLFKKFFIHEFFGKIQFLTNQSLNTKDGFDLIFFTATIARLLLIYKSITCKTQFNDFIEVVSLVSRFYGGKDSLDFEEKEILRISGETQNYLYTLFF